MTLATVPDGQRKRTTAPMATVSARPREARKKTTAAPRRSTIAPAHPKTASLGIHSKANASPVSAAERVVARTSSGMPWVAMANARASAVRGR